MMLIQVGLNGTSQQVSGNATDATQSALISSSSTVSPLSQYLVHPTINEQANVAKKSLPKARLLTSETCLAELWKKEEDKGKQLRRRKGRNVKEKRKARLQMLEEKRRNAKYRV